MPKGIGHIRVIALHCAAIRIQATIPNGMAKLEKRYQFQGIL